MDYKFIKTWSDFILNETLKTHEIDSTIDNIETELSLQCFNFEIKKVKNTIELTIFEFYSIQDLKIGRGNIPTFRYFFDEKRRVYYPDIYIPKDNRIIEVKSFYTYEKELEKNLAKRESVIKSGYLFDFYIMEK